MRGEGFKATTFYFKKFKSYILNTHHQIHTSNLLRWRIFSFLNDKCVADVLGWDGHIVLLQYQLFKISSILSNQNCKDADR